MNNTTNLSTDKIREALHFQELTPEEKQSRGILGRLYGPCASFIAPTRNDRFYGDELWTNVFEKNEIVKEMFDNGGIPMELDHPLGDREETTSINIAAILPERPKKDKDGHLITYVDILDTPSGKIVYTLAKYGFKWGISSRGSGELISDYDGHESVDPTSYDFQTFDLVLLPAVKDARLTFVESYDAKQKTAMKKMKRELKEALSTASDGDRKIMENALDNLKINLDDENLSPENVVTEAISDKMFDLNNAPKTTPDGIEIEYVNMEDFDNWLNEGLDDLDEAKKDDEKEDKTEEEKASDKDKKEDKKDKEEDKSDKKKDDKSDEESEEVEPKNEFTVKEITDAFKGLDKDAVVKVLPIEFGGEELNINLYLDKADEDNLVIGGTIVPEENDENIDNPETGETVDVFGNEDVAASDTGAEDIVDDAFIEDFKKTVRENKALEQKVKTLENEKTVSDAKVNELDKELNQYKEAFNRTSQVASQYKKSKLEIQNLNNQLAEKDNQIKALSEKLSNNKLTESLDSTKLEVTKLKQQLVEQATNYKQKYAERTDVAKKYKAMYLGVMQKYVESKANMLNVRASEITSRLDKNYTTDDVDQVCDQILNEGMTMSNMSHLPLTNANTKVKFSEGLQRQQAPKEDAGYEIADWALELANIEY